MDKVITNFGQINGQRIVTFAKTHNDDVFIPAKWKDMDDPEGRYMLQQEGLLISPHEAFRRWKVARKAWRTRKYKNQPSLL